jgi:hypothetical protein
MTRFPRSPGWTLVLRLHQETVHDFILLFMLPCSLHLTPLATGSLEPSLLVFSTPGGLTGDDLSRLFFTCTNTSQARNPHLQYLAKNQSTQRCQTLITPGSDHPPVLEPHMVLTPNGLRMSELRPFYSNTAICPEILDCAVPNVFSISTCTGLQIC